MNSFSEIFANIAISHMLLKVDSMDYIFVPDGMGLYSTIWRITVSKLLQIISHICAFDRSVPLFDTLVPLNS